MTSPETLHWPSPPIAGSEVLVPVTSWEEMHHETLVTGVEFEAFWLESVEEEVAYFFRWLGEPRATVLVVWGDGTLSHVECRGKGDRLLSAIEARDIVTEVHRLFLQAGFQVSAEGSA